MNEYAQGEEYASQLAANYGLADMRAEVVSVALLAETLSTCEAYNYACGMLDEAIMLASLYECHVNEKLPRIVDLGYARFAGCAFSGNGKSIGECAREGCSACRKTLGWR